MEQIIQIAKSNVDYLKKAIAKLNKKCRKLGCPEMVLSFNNPTSKSYEYHPVTGNHLLYPMVIEYVDATLEYEIPLIEGWELIAKLDIFPGKDENQVLISGIPEMVIPAEYQNATEIKCDHCGYDRNRHHSILLRNTENGEYKEVGSTCVKDFFGHDPRGFMFMAGIDFPEIANFKDEDNMGFGRKIWAYELKDVLRITSAVMAKFGFTSKKKAYDYELESTSDKVWDNLEPTPDVLRHRKENLVEVTDDDIKLADATLEHFLNVNAEGNDYLLNCQKLAKLNYVPSKFMGFACSMVSSYQRVADKKEVEEKAAKLPASEWVGQVGDRLKSVQVEVTFTKIIEGYYGTSTLYIFRDDNGSEYKTFYTGTKWEYNKGETVLLTGTISKHDEYNGKKATMLKRAVCNNAPEETFTVKEFAVA